MWQAFLLLYFVFGATSYLLRRVLAQKIAHHNRLINAVFFVFFLLPTGLLLSLFYPNDLNVGWVNLLWLLGGSIIWPLFNILAFRANQEVDVGVYTVISNISPVFTLMIALTFLGETLTNMELVGVGLLISSGVLATLPRLRRNASANIKGVLFCVASAGLLGIAVAYERFMLNRIDFGAYLLLGWGSQIAWSAFLARKEWHLLPRLVEEIGSRQLLAYGVTNALKSAAFILALLLSGSAAIIGAASDFMAVVVIIAAYFFLRERDHLFYKFAASLIGIIGLYLIAG